jgi:hypothetical protein
VRKTLKVGGYPSAGSHNSDSRPVPKIGRVPHFSRTLREVGILA